MSCLALGGLHNKNPWVRREAANGLIGHTSKSVKAELIKALKDRSHMVKFIVVEAMRKRKSLRDPQAIEYLQRIVSSKSCQKNSPGLVEYAKEVIVKINSEATT